MKDIKKQMSVIAQYLRDNCVKPVEKRFIVEDGQYKTLRVFKDKNGTEIAFSKTSINRDSPSNLKIESLLKTNNGLLRENSKTMDIVLLYSGNKYEFLDVYPRTITSRSVVSNFNTTNRYQKNSLFFISEGIVPAGPISQKGYMSYLANKKDFKTARFTFSKALKI